MLKRTVNFDRLKEVLAHLNPNVVKLVSIEVGLSSKFSVITSLTVKVGVSEYEMLPHSIFFEALEDLVRGIDKNITVHLKLSYN